MHPASVFCLDASACSLYGVWGKEEKAAAASAW